MAITKAQALTLDTFHHPSTRHGKPHCSVWRRNGATQTWVRDPERFRVPVKYGLYAYGQLTNAEAPTFYAPDDCPVCHGTRH